MAISFTSGEADSTLPDTSRFLPEFAMPTIAANTVMKIAKVKKCAQKFGMDQASVLIGVLTP